MDSKVIEDYPKDAVSHCSVYSGQPPKVDKRTYAAASGLFLGWIAQQQLNTGVTTVLNAINQDLGPITNFSWVFTGWLVSIAVLSGPIGSFSDRIGRRWFFVVGNIFALLGDIIAATAHSVNVVIVGMAIAGVGAACQQLALAALSEMFPKKHRGFVQGAVQLAPFPFTACGSLIGAAMVKYATWRWVYYLNIIICALALIAVLIFYHPTLPSSHTSNRQVLKSTDWIGLAMSMIGIIGLGLGFGPAAFALHGWGTAAVLVPVLVGASIVVGLVFWERAKSSNQLYSPSIFTRQYGVAIAIVVAITMPVYVLTFVWPYQVAAIYTTDPIKAGLYNFPMGFGTEVGALLSAVLMTMLGRAHIQLAAACLIMSIFLGLQATLTPNKIQPALAYLSLGGVANGFVQVLVIVMMQFAAPDHYIGTATGILIMFRYMGAALGIAICLTVVRSLVESTLPGNIAKATIPLGLPQKSVPALLGALQSGNATVIMSVPGISPLIIQAAKTATLNTYAHAYRIMYYPPLGLGIIAIVIAIFFAKDITAHMTDQLAVGINKPRDLRLRRDPEKTEG